MKIGTVVKLNALDNAIIYGKKDNCFLAVDHNAGFYDINKILLVCDDHIKDIVKQGISMDQINKNVIPFDITRRNEIGLSLSSGFLKLGSIVKTKNKPEEYYIMGRHLIKGYLPYNYVGFNKEKGWLLFNTKDIEKVYYSAGNLEQLSSNQPKRFNDELHDLKYYIKWTIYLLISSLIFGSALFGLNTQFFGIMQLPIIFVKLVAYLLLYQLHKSKVLTISFALLTIFVYALQVLILLR